MSAPDRDIITRLLAVVGPVLTRAQEVIGAAQRVPELEAELARVRAEQADDTAGDVAALQPLADAIDAALALANPAAEQDPDVAPVTAIEDVPAVANGDLPADTTDGRTDAPTDQV
ncbi:hypothetical protein [Microcystis phage Mwe-JY05]